MLPYENHTTAALKAQRDDVKKLLILIDGMKKPENFTYMDVSNLHSHMSELLKSINSQIEVRA